MSTVLVEPQTQILMEQSIILHDISWQTYERLMIDHEDRSIPRFTYNKGFLEIFMPSEKHEETGQLLAQIVYEILNELDLDYRGLGSTTFRREEMDKGVEPDGCFYIQSVGQVKSISKIDLAIHPPPDLVIEIDITSPSINRFPIYAEFGVPEIWRYLNGTVKIHILQDDEYIESDTSVVLPFVTGAALTGFLAESNTQNRSAWVKNIRNWVHSITN